MTSRDNRGGPTPPDGVPRPPSVPFGRGPNRSDLAALPGTPGTALPAGVDSGLGYGEVGPARRALEGIPLTGAQPNVPKGGLLSGPTQNPGEPVTSGSPLGDGPGPESLVQSGMDIGNKLAISEMRAAYPIIMRLATLPNATQQTKILAQRIRAALPLSPEQMPVPPNAAPTDGAWSPGPEEQTPMTVNMPQTEGNPTVPMPEQGIQGAGSGTTRQV